MIRKFAIRLLRGFCHPDYYDDILGDLEELYQEQRKPAGEFKAQMRYFIDVVLLFRLSLIRPIYSNSKSNMTGMFKNYFKITYRTLLARKSYTIINVLGLAVGLSAFLLIHFYVSFERSYDSFHLDADQIYRLTTDQIVDGQTGNRDAMSFNPSGAVIQEEIPEVTASTVTYNVSNLDFQKGEALIGEKNVIMADENFIPLFGYKVISGGAEALLSEPNSVVLTASKARKYFGEEEALGKELFIYSDFDRPFKVVGVIEDIPLNTHFWFDIIVSISTIESVLVQEGWSNFNYYTYLKIQPGIDIQALEEKMVPIRNKYMSAESTLFFSLQRVQDIHLRSEQTFEPQIQGSESSVNFLEIISFFILLIAWVNYINLSTSYALNRAKEVGLRKVIGATSRQLRTQFLFESLVINLLGGVVALLIIELSIPYFNSLVGQKLVSHSFSEPIFLSGLLLLVFAGTLAAGIYPAFIMSKFKISRILKGTYRNSKGGVLLRKALVVLQFTATIILIAGTFIVSLQVDFMKNRDIGMDIDRVVGFANPRVVEDEEGSEEARFKAFQNELISNPTVLSTATTSSLPGGKGDEIGSSAGGVKVVGKTDIQDVTIYFQWLDDTYFDMMEVQFVAGRPFARDRVMDTASVIVNETFLRKMGIKPSADVLGSYIQYGKDPENNRYPIIGIIKDANRSSLKSQVEPTSYFYADLAGNSVVKLAAGNIKEGMGHIEDSWTKFYPNSALEYKFLDERFHTLYAQERKFSSVFGTFSFLTMLVAGLGLYALSSFMASQKTKEVGIRKVLGGSVFHISTLFYSEFIKLTLIAGLISIPLVYAGMQSWLDDYAYRIDFPWLMVALSVLLVIVVAVSTVSFQIYKVAILNPAKTLRYE